MTLQGVDAELRLRHLPALSSTLHHLTRWERRHPSDDGTLRASFATWIGRMDPSRSGGIMTVFSEGGKVRMQTLQDMSMQVTPTEMHVQGLESPVRDLVGTWQPAPTEWNESVNEEEMMDRVVTRGQDPESIATFWRPPWAPGCEILFVPLESEAEEDGSARSIPTMWSAWIRFRARASPMPGTETTASIVPAPGTMMRLYYMYLHAQHKVYTLCEDEGGSLWIYSM